MSAGTFCWLVVLNKLLHSFGLTLVPVLRAYFCGFVLGMVMFLVFVGNLSFCLSKINGL